MNDEDKNVLTEVRACAVDNKFPREKIQWMMTILPYLLPLKETEISHLEITESLGCEVLEKGGIHWNKVYHLGVQGLQSVGLKIRVTGKEQSYVFKSGSFTPLRSLKKIILEDLDKDINWLVEDILKHCLKNGAKPTANLIQLRKILGTMVSNQQAVWTKNDHSKLRFGDFQD